MEGGDPAGEMRKDRGREKSKAMWEAYFVLRVCPGSGNILHVCIQNIIFAEIVSLKKSKAGGANIFLAAAGAAAAQVELPFGYASTCLALAPERKHRYIHTHICGTHTCVCHKMVILPKKAVSAALRKLVLPRTMATNEEKIYIISVKSTRKKGV